MTAAWYRRSLLTLCLLMAAVIGYQWAAPMVPIVELELDYRPADGIQQFQFSLPYPRDRAEPEFVVRFPAALRERPSGIERTVKRVRLADGQPGVAIHLVVGYQTADQLALYKAWLVTRPLTPPRRTGTRSNAPQFI